VHPHRFDELSKKLLLNPRLLAIVAACLSDEPLGAQTMYYWKHPGSLGQALHQDNLYLQASDAAGCMAAWIAIDSADEENGCMQVVPGSHRLDIICPEKADPSQFYFSDYVAPPEGLSAVPVLMSPGDVLFFGGRTIHGSDPNRSKARSRRSFICHYIGARSSRSAGFYNPLIRADGTEFSNEESDGGPCGVFVSAPH
jgi:ectoine hydroxylase-related dioxygenase (phytanoyl-CoA dioxygenase family)